MTDGRTGSVTPPEGMKGMGRYHALSFCPKAGAGKERAHPHQTCGLLGVCFMPSQKGAIRPFFLVAGLYFLEGALAEHAEDCSVLREQRREEEKPATRESLVCPYVAVFFQKGSKIS